MPSQRIVLIVSLGAGVGVLVGSAVTLWLVKRRLCDNMMQLLEQISLLTSQVDQLRKVVEERQLRKLEPTGCIEEDDDVYEDAYGELA